jgi:hypothetical protein
MGMETTVSKQVEVGAEVALDHLQQRREDAVDVLAEALWELWLRRHVQRGQQAPTWSAEEGAHG